MTIFSRLIVLLGFLTLADFLAAKEPAKVNPKPGDEHGRDGIRLLVEPGDEQKAIDYYTRVSAELSLPAVPALDQRTLQQMLDYCGYAALKASDLEALDSDVLMDYARLRVAVSNQPEFQQAFDPQPIAADDLLASRFFAPKISDVSSSGGPVELGWRKLARFKARNGSTAHAKGSSRSRILELA